MTKHYGIKITLDDYFSPVTEDNSIGLFNIGAATTSTISPSTYSVTLDNVDYMVVNSICRIQKGSDYVDCTILAINTETKVVNLNKYDADIMPLLTAGSTFTCNSAFFLAMDTSLNDTYSHWIDGILEDIGTVQRSLKKVKIGYLQNQDSLKITINNLAKFWDSIRGLDVSNLYSIAGAKVELWYFEISQIVRITKEIVIWTGFCEQPDYDSLTYNITAKCFTGREAVMTREESGQTTKISFGEGARVKLELLDTGEIEYYDASTLTCISSYYPAFSSSKKIYPLYVYSYSAEYDRTVMAIKIGEYAVVDETKYGVDTTFLKTNYFIGIYEGGEIKETRPFDPDYEIDVVVEDGDLHLYIAASGTIEDLQATTEVSTDPNSFIVIVPPVAASYSVDPLSALRFYGDTTILESGDEVSNNTLSPYLFSDQYLNGKLYSAFTPVNGFRVPDIKMTINGGIVYRQFATGLVNFQVATPAGSSWNRNVTAIPTIVSNGSIIDKDDTTGQFISLAIAAVDGSVEKIMGLSYRINCDTFGSDGNLYVGIKCKLTTTISGTAYIKIVPVYFGNKNDFSSTVPTYTAAINIGDSPDFNFDNINPRYFGHPTGNYNYLSSYFNLGNLDGKTIEAFDIFIGQQSVFTTDTLRIDLYEACLFQEIAFDKSESIYPRISGRQFNTTSWSRAITSTNYIRSASDIIEHCLRFGNWRDVALNTTPGFTYAEYAKILNTGTGSFANAALVATGEYFPLAGNVTQEKTNIELIEDIVSEAGLVVYETKDGYAACRVNYSGDAVESNTTIADYIEVEELTITEQDISEIYCEPTANYDYDPRTDKYLGSIAVTNTSKGTFSASYVTGDISTNDKEELWTLCRRLYLQSRKVTTQPDELKNLQFANDPIYGKDVALRYLKTFVRSMFEKTVQFETATDLVQEWELGRIITVKAANQTNNNVISCMVTDIKCELIKDRTATITGILLDEIPADTLYLDNYSSDNDFQDVYSGTQYNDI